MSAGERMSTTAQSTSSGSTERAPSAASLRPLPAASIAPRSGCSVGWVGGVERETEPKAGRGN